MQVVQAAERRIMVFSILCSFLMSLHGQEEQCVLSFDTSFPVAPHKPVIAEACELLDDLHDLHTFTTLYKERLIATDMLVGRTVRLMSSVESLLTQQKGTPIPDQDAKDLMDILHQVQDAYNTLDTFPRYHLILPLFTDIQHKITQAHP